MGWSLPEVPARPDTQPWSPWVCLSITFAGVFIALVRVVLHSPSGSLPTLASGYWLPLTGYTLVGVTITVTFYLLWWEIQTFRVRNWNNWRRNMHLAWQRQAHLHLCVTRHVVLTADPQLLSRLAGVASESSDETSLLTLLPEEAFIPGISRFEQLCRLLINQIKTILSQAYPSGPLTVIIQTSAPDKKQEIQYFSLLWEDEKLPWMPDIHALSNSSVFNNWNKFLSTARYPLLVLALHYRQPEEALAEFACALLLLPEAMLKSSEQRDAVRVFRAGRSRQAAQHDPHDPIEAESPAADRRLSADHVRRPFEAGQPGSRRGARTLRRSGVPNDHPAQHETLRSTQLRETGAIVRRILVGQRQLPESGQRIHQEKPKKITEPHHERENQRLGPWSGRNF